MLTARTLLTLCPSPSTRSMLESQSFSNVRLWPRGVDLSQFGPLKRCNKMRELWGIGEAPGRVSVDLTNSKVVGVHHSGRKTSLPLTPPASPIVVPAGDVGQTQPFTAEPMAINSAPSRVCLLYVGRVSWEKNLVLLLHAYGRLSAYLPTGSPLPKLVFVGDGPAKTELETICSDRGYDATFMGHRQGEELAACYASADIFAFPSFTETFGQVVLEALASGLPVIGLDAEGTRDLVQHASTGLLLPLPPVAAANTKVNPSRTWPTICRDVSHPLFSVCVDGYAQLLARATTNHTERAAMGHKACTDGIQGFTWWDAMERCVDGYRESIRVSRQARQVRITIPPATLTPEPTPTPTQNSSPKISRVNRALSSRLAHRGWPRDKERENDLGGSDNDAPPTTPSPRLRLRLLGKSDTAETLWHIKNLAKAFLAAMLFWWIWKRHLASQGREMGWDEITFRPAAAVGAF